VRDARRPQSAQSGGESLLVLWGIVGADRQVPACGTLGALKARRVGVNLYWLCGHWGADRQVPACGTLGALKARRAEVNLY